MIKSGLIRRLIDFFSEGRNELTTQDYNKHDEFKISHAISAKILKPDEIKPKDKKDVEQKIQE